MYITFVAGACSFFVSTLITPKYLSEITILIVQKEANASSASQSVEYLSEVFSQVVYTELFLDDVLSSKDEIASNFSTDPSKRRQQWKNEVEVKKISEAGILKIKVKSESRVQSFLIAQAIAENFATNSEKYHGSSDAVIAKLIDGPITSGSPAIPNIPLNTGFGLLVGFLGSLVIIGFFDKFDLKVVGKERAYDRMVSEQIEKQLKKREEKKELSYEEEDAKEEKDTRQKAKDYRSGTEVAKSEEESERPSKQTEEKPDLEGSMVDADEFSSSFQPKRDGELKNRKIEEPKKIYKIRKKPETVKKSKGQDEASQRKNLLSKLYSKSLFADKKFEKMQAERASHQRETNGNQLPIIESVKKITPANNGDKEGINVPRTTSKSAAPDNLPIFLDEQKDTVSEISEMTDKKDTGRSDETVKKASKEQKKMETETKYKEFEPIEHISGPDDYLEKDQPAAETKEAQTAEKSEGEMPDVEHVVGYREEEVSDAEREPSEEEVKERLNKLLKGEL